MRERFYNFSMFGVFADHESGREGLTKPEMPRAFRELQLQRLESRMSWNGAGVRIRARVV